MIMTMNHEYSAALSFRRDPASLVGFLVYHLQHCYSGH